MRRVREEFGIGEFVIVGDRGMLSHKAIEELREHDGIGWITALKSVSIRALLEQGAVQLDLFDERNLFELTHPDYPGERLVACRNPELARLRAHKRESLLQATEAALDGLYIIRTSLPVAQADDAQCVLYYKQLAQVERGFRSMKSIDLHVRPIHHRLAERVRAHIFLCMLVYYVEWHLREAWRELMFADEDQAAKATRDPVAPAKRSAAAQRKASTRTLDDGTPVHSFSTLLSELSTIVRNTSRTPGADADAPTFELTTVATAQQQRALELVRQITV